MQKSDIIALPNPHLRERSKKVGIITDDIKEFIEGMKKATLDWEDSREHEVGVALAAIQVDRPLRIIVIRNNFDNKSDRTFSVFVNPVITKYEGTIEEDYEGCLSVPDIYGKVPRYSKVRVRALDENGREFRVTAEGFLARVFQHEVDHTNGIVFVDHIKEKTNAFFKLKDNGHLESLDYEKNIRTNRILW
ncbi:MAG TPA: peptide deformylase [Candidatus Saccharimonadales bacterium]|nr:peptide deformylase [Candidatus Saccharimonadales bacterium]